MARTTADFEREFLADLQAITGYDLETWMQMIDSSGLQKMPDLIQWIKSEYELNHMQATMLVNISRNDGKPVYSDTAALLDSLFERKEELRPLYEALEAALLETIDGVTFLPKKTYVSITNGREFAVARMMSKEIRVGMDLGDEPFGDYVQKGKGLGAMPRISHMVVVTDLAEIDDKLLGYLQQANGRVNE